MSAKPIGVVNDDGSMSLSGVTSPYSSIEIFYLGAYHYVQSDASGQWSYDIAADQVQGPDSVRIRIDGVYQSAADPAHFPPTLDQFLDASGNDQQWNIEYPLPLLKGSAEAYATVTVSIDGKVVGSVQADAEGHWSYQTETMLQNGKHMFSVSANDVANTSAKGMFVQAPYGWTPPEHSVEPTPPVDAVKPVEPVDPINPTDPPKLTVTFDGMIDHNHSTEIPLGGTTNDALPTVYGTAPAGSIVQILDKTTGRTLEFAQTDADGHWQATIGVTLNEGHHELYASFLGNNSNSFPVNVDLHSSPIEPINPVQPVDPVTPIEPTDPSNPVDPGHQVDPVAPADPQAPTISVWQVEGNPFAGYHFEQLDAGATTHSVLPEVFGSAEPHSNVDIYDGKQLIATVTTDAQGNWDWNPAVHGPMNGGSSLADGQHSLYAVASGQQSAHFDFTVDRLPPSIDVAQNATAPIFAYDGSPAAEVKLGLTGSAPAYDTVTIYDGDRAIATVQATRDGTWSWSADANSAEGSHHVTVVGSDGKVSGAFDYSVEPAAQQANTLSVDQLLVSGDEHLFAQTPHETKQASATLDVQDLTHTQSGGVHASVAIDAQHLMIHHESQHH